MYAMSAASPEEFSSRGKVERTASACTRASARSTVSAGERATTISASQRARATLRIVLITIGKTRKMGQEEAWVYCRKSSDAGAFGATQTSLSQMKLSLGFWMRGDSP